VFRAVGIVGVGLLGGSLGLALKQRGLARQVVGLAPVDHPPALAELQTAKTVGAIDAIQPFGSRQQNAVLAGIDAVVVCTPVQKIAHSIAMADAEIGRDAFITDVGGAKSAVVRALPDSIHTSRYLGSHPMAGSERSGVEAASAQLFAGRTCILTPTETTSKELLGRLTRFWEALGMTVMQLSPEQHDEVVGRTSHLPHVAASAIAALLDAGDRPFVGAGLKDTTRIAGGNPALWTGILSANRTAVLAALARLRKEFDAVAAALEKDDRNTLQEWLTNAKRVRDALGS
jgi:prephenate dehydrogenase